MSGEFGHDDGFYSGEYGDNQNQQQDISYVQDGYGGEQQFGQFDYTQSGGVYGEGPYVAPQEPMYNPSIMTPDPSAYAAKEAGDNFEDEPPLLEELGINFNHIVQKT